MAAKPLKKSFIKIIKVSFLLFVREGYLLIKNLLGLVYHPFLTLRTIRKGRDLSQTFLIGTFLASPTIVAILTGLSVLLLTSIFRLSTIPFKNLIFFGNLYAFLFTTTAFLYLLYWVYQIIKKNHFNLK